MSTGQTESQSLSISQEQLMALVRAMTGGSGGREDDEHPLPPGPWDPIIRQSLERMNRYGPHSESWRDLERAAFGDRVSLRRAQSLFGPSPEPWKLVLASILARHPEIWDAIGGGHSLGEEVALNPQPLPPRFAFLASLVQTLISRAELLQEIADATQREGEQQGIIIVSGYVSRFIDDFCGNGFRFKYPFPGPRPHWFDGELNGLDLLVMATQFDQAANETYSPELRQSLVDASAKLAEAGLSKMQ